MLLSRFGIGLLGGEVSVTYWGEVSILWKILESSMHYATYYSIKIFWIINLQRQVLVKYRHVFQES